MTQVYIWKFSEIGLMFTTVAMVEKEKRKMTVYSELLVVKGLYDELFQSMVEEMLVLRGKLAEIRDAFLARTIQRTCQKKKLKELTRK